MGKSNRSSLIITMSIIILLVFAFVLVYYANVPNEVIVEGEIIRIAGINGTSVAREAITSIELLDDIPSVEKRVNGFSFRNVKKGYFRLADWNNGWLYLQSNNGPYISIRYNVEGFILINYNSPEETMKVYEMIYSN